MRVSPFLLKTWMQISPSNLLLQLSSLPFSTCTSSNLTLPSLLFSLNCLHKIGLLLFFLFHSHQTLLLHSSPPLSPPSPFSNHASPTVRSNQLEKSCEEISEFVLSLFPLGGEEERVEEEENRMKGSKERGRKEGWAKNEVKQKLEEINFVLMKLVSCFPTHFLNKRKGEGSKLLDSVVSFLTHFINNKELSQLSKSERGDTLFLISSLLSKNKSLLLLSKNKAKALERKKQLEELLDFFYEKTPTKWKPLFLKLFDQMLKECIDGNDEGADSVSNGSSKAKALNIYSKLFKLVWQLKSENGKATSKILRLLSERLRSSRLSLLLSKQERNQLMLLFTPFFFTTIPTKQVNKVEKKKRENESREKKVFGPFIHLPPPLQKSSLELVYYICSPNFVPCFQLMDALGQVSLFLSFHLFTFLIDISSKLFSNCLYEENYSRQSLMKQFVEWLIKTAKNIKEGKSDSFNQKRRKLESPSSTQPSREEENEENDKKRRIEYIQEKIEEISNCWL